MSGPYETDREAHAAAIAAIPPAGGWVILGGEQNRQLLTQACEAAGITLGTYDRRIIGWLADYEDATCAVIAGLITRAREAGQALTGEQLATVLDALDVAADYKRDRAATCPDCDADPADLCGTCEYRLATADEYDALAEALRGQP